MASIIAADQAAARADRQTIGVQVADRALDAAELERDKACGPGHGRTIACKSRQAEVTRLEAEQTQAVDRVAALAKPEAADFAALVTWATAGTSIRTPVTSTCCGCGSGPSCRKWAASS